MSLALYAGKWRKRWYYKEVGEEEGDEEEEGRTGCLCMEMQLYRNSEEVAWRAGR